MMCGIAATATMAIISVPKATRRLMGTVTGAAILLAAIRTGNPYLLAVLRWFES